MRTLNVIRGLFSNVGKILGRLESIQQAIGRIEYRQLVSQGYTNISDYEFQVFSQWGEDGIIQYLVNKIPIDQRIFIEFGVENYTQANTRFLIKNNNWSGLIIDGSESHIQAIKLDPIYWTHNLKAVHAFIDRDNINDLISQNGLTGDIGLLSIDIDGNDYWVWDKIEIVSPRIVICEYNGRFGPHAQVTIPYDPQFIRSKAHYSNLYYGASIAALSSLALAKGYVLVGGNRAGNNVFFVRKDLANWVNPVTPQEAYRQAQFRESRGPAGDLTTRDWKDGFCEAANLPVVDIENGNIVPIYSLNLQNK